MLVRPAARSFAIMPQFDVISPVAGSAFGNGRRALSRYATVMFIVLAPAACQRSGAPRTVNERSAPVSTDTAAEPGPVDASPPRDPPDPNQWLVVTRTSDGAAGGHATGSFLKERNRIVLTTRDVEQFTLDTSRIPIDWDRLVVISIDGTSSELRKRDYDVLHFARNKYGAWNVIEP